MCNNVNKLPAALLTVKEKEIKEVEIFRYLGSLVSTNGSPEHEIVTCTRSTFGKLKNIWRSATFPLKLKLRLFNSNVWLVTNVWF
jgi:hypothetical protein